MSNIIGLFDSGIGGLTVLDNLIKHLPNEHYVYIGDNKNCPYGDKTKEQLFKYACGITEYFISRNISIVVLACNTTSANVLDLLKEKYPLITFIGVIDATVEFAKEYKAKDCLVIATNATIQSGKYQLLLEPYFEQVTGVATPNLVGYIENETDEKIIETYLQQIFKDYLDISTIVLGCTHYPILSKQISSILTNTTILSSSIAICKKVEQILDSNSSNRKVEIYTTGNVAQFIHSSKNFFNYENISVNQLNIDD